MPSYDYYCPANEKTVEVFHSMSAAIATWGELAEKAGLDLGDTPAETPVEKLIRGSFVSVADGGGAQQQQPRGGGHGCGPGSCGCGKY